MTSAPDLPLQFKSGNAGSGRVYNAYIGGKDNFEADRALAAMPGFLLTGSRAWPLAGKTGPISLRDRER